MRCNCTNVGFVMLVLGLIARTNATKEQISNYAVASSDEALKKTRVHTSTPLASLTSNNDHRQLSGIAVQNTTSSFSSSPSSSQRQMAWKSANKRRRHPGDVTLSSPDREKSRDSLLLSTLAASSLAGLPWKTRSTPAAFHSTSSWIKTDQERSTRDGAANYRVISNDTDTIVSRNVDSSTTDDLKSGNISGSRELLIEADAEWELIAKVDAGKIMTDAGVADDVYDVVSLGLRTDCSTVVTEPVTSPIVSADESANSDRSQDPDPITSTPSQSLKSNPQNSKDVNNCRGENNIRGTRPNSPSLQILLEPRILSQAQSYTTQPSPLPYFNIDSSSNSDIRSVNFKEGTDFAVGSYSNEASVPHAINDSDNNEGDREDSVIYDGDSEIEDTWLTDKDSNSTSDVEVNNVDDNNWLYEEVWPGEEEQSASKEHDDYTDNTAPHDDEERYDVVVDDSLTKHDDTKEDGEDDEDDDYRANVRVERTRTNLPPSVNQQDAGLYTLDWESSSRLNVGPRLEEGIWSEQYHIVHATHRSKFNVFVWFTITFLVLCVIFVLPLSLLCRHRQAVMSGIQLFTRNSYRRECHSTAGNGIEEANDLLSNAHV